MSYTIIKIFIKGANWFSKWTTRCMWANLVWIVIGLFSLQAKTQRDQNELGLILVSAEYRHAMVPKFIHNLPPEHHNGPIPINNKILLPVNDARDIPIPVHIKIFATPKMEETVAIKSVDILDTSEIKDMLKKHKTNIKAIKHKLIEVDTL